MTVVEARVAGRYRLGPPLGIGGMGQVWLARDEVLGRDVAIKQVALPFGLSDTEREEMRMRTLREARAAARLNHPNVVKIYDVVQSEEQPWIVMEYVRSRSLLQVIEESGPLAVEEVAGVGLGVLSALDAASRAGVVHRDVKPSNVLIGDDGRVVLTDFGSAIMDESGGAITRTGVIIGSPQYIAPERATNGISTAESDLWSLGATLYAAVEGRAPYSRPTAMATLLALATKRPDPMRLAGPLKPVLNGLLQKNPQARMGVAEVERRLRRVADVQTTVHLRRVPGRRRPTDEGRHAQSAAGVPYLERNPVESASTHLRPVEPAASAVDGYDDPLSTALDRALTSVRAEAEAEAQAQADADADGRAAPGPAAAPAAGPAKPAAPPVGRLTGWRDQRWPLRIAAGVVVLLIVALGAAAVRMEVMGGSSASGPEVKTTGGSPTAVSPAAVVPSRAIEADPEALPAGFTWWRDQSGFRVAFPAGWEKLREGPEAMLFCEPGGAKTLRVRAWDGTAHDPVAYLAEQETQAKLAGYNRMRMAPMADHPGAEWEYTYTDPKLGKLHGLERAFFVMGRAYLIQWRIPPNGWQDNLGGFGVITNSFNPPGRPPTGAF